jgi:hypothetical protein
MIISETIIKFIEQKYLNIYGTVGEYCSFMPLVYIVSNSQRRSIQHLNPQCNCLNCPIDIALRWFIDQIRKAGSAANPLPATCHPATAISSTLIAKPTTLWVKKSPGLLLNQNSLRLCQPPPQINCLEHLFSTLWRSSSHRIEKLREMLSAVTLASVLRIQASPVFLCLAAC